MRTLIHLAAFGAGLAVFLAFWSPLLGLVTLALACGGMWIYWQNRLDLIAAIASGVGALSWLLASDSLIGFALVGLSTLVAFICCFPRLFGGLLEIFFDDLSFD